MVQQALEKHGVAGYVRVPGGGRGTAAQPGPQRAPAFLCGVRDADPGHHPDVLPSRRLQAFL